MLIVHLNHLKLRRFQRYHFHHKLCYSNQRIGLMERYNMTFRKSKNTKLHKNNFCKFNHDLSCVLKLHQLRPMAERSL